MSAAVAPTAIDRSDFRTVMTSGTKVGLMTAAGVVLYVAVARQLPGASALARGLETLVVLAVGSMATFLPGRWCAARSVEGIAGAAAVGLWAGVVFALADIALLRPLHAYPWTWDDIGGGSTWWYLPMWWMLGTFLAWMGGARTAACASSGSTGFVPVAGPVLLGAVVLAALARLAGLAILLPVAAGIGFTVTIVALVVVALARA